MKKKKYVVKICTFLLTLASVAVVNAISPFLIGEAKLPAKYDQ